MAIREKKFAICVDNRGAEDERGCTVAEWRRPPSGSTPLPPIESVTLTYDYFELVQ